MSVKTLILTEKPSVARDFAAALGCKRTADGLYDNADIIIASCRGHLFELEEPAHYGTSLPIIPEIFDIHVKADAVKEAALVIKVLIAHKNDNILIATDADREGEVIARECLAQAGITNHSQIKRFWVSQALTPDVIKDGIRNARPLSEYDSLADKGFARQRADWLIGMNCSRWLGAAAGRNLSIGRVQTALLSVIEARCEAIKCFKPTKYYEHNGTFISGNGAVCKGLYSEDGKTTFPDSSRTQALKQLIGKVAHLVDKKEEDKTAAPPKLYNLNALQKDAFTAFGYTAERTLQIAQQLYEELKCTSYPRTPSRVMGSGNVSLCADVAKKIMAAYPELAVLEGELKIDLSNKHCFDDKKLEAHHALIPLKVLVDNATEEQRNIYNLIMRRFMIAFLSDHLYKKLSFIIDVSGHTFRVTGKKTTSEGWKQFEKLSNQTQKPADKDDDISEQPLDKIDWSNIKLSDVDTVQKTTRPPKPYNEGSILSFMENPKEQDDDKKLIGLGTPATRHTFIPKLLKRGYITNEKNNFTCTELGAILLKAVRNSAIKELADVDTTTLWEERMETNPATFERDIKDYVRFAVSKTPALDIANLPCIHGEMICPICKKPIRESQNSFYCTGYKDGCSFKSIWKKAFGTTFNKTDIKALLANKKTGIKKCMSKNGKPYECCFMLDNNNGFAITPIFNNTQTRKNHE